MAVKSTQIEHMGDVVAGWLKSMLLTDAIKENEGPYPSERRMSNEPRRFEQSA